MCCSISRCKPINYKKCTAIAFETSTHKAKTMQISAMKLFKNKLTSSWSNEFKL